MFSQHSAITVFCSDFQCFCFVLLFWVFVIIFWIGEIGHNWHTFIVIIIVVVEYVCVFWLFQIIYTFLWQWIVNFHLLFFFFCSFVCIVYYVLEIPTDKQSVRKMDEQNYVLKCNSDDISKSMQLNVLVVLAIFFFFCRIKQIISACSSIHPFKVK